MGNLRCSFCTNSQMDGYKIIAGPGVYICSECVQNCADILNINATKDVDADIYEEVPKVEPRVVVEFTGSWRGDLSPLDTHINNLKQYTGKNIGVKQVRKCSTKRGA